MNKCQIIVKQIPGYYVLALQFYFAGDSNSWISFSESSENSLHQHVSAIHEIATDIEDNFDVAELRVFEDSTSIHIKCMRSELRKIETWLSLGNYEIEPLRKWKNERS